MAYSRSGDNEYSSSWASQNRVTTRADMITDMRKAFGELHDSPNVINVYNHLPTPVLKAASETASRIHSNMIMDVTFGYALTLGATTAGALSHGFAGAALGLVTSVGVTVTKVILNDRALQRLQDSLPAVLNKNTGPA